MAVAIYRAEQEWLTRQEVARIAAAAFAEWDDESLAEFYSHLSGDDGRDALSDRDKVIVYLASTYAISYSQMSELITDAYATLRLGDLRIIQFAGDEYDPTVWDEVVALFHYTDFGSLPAILDPRMQFSDDEYIADGANFTSNSAFLDAFRHTARTHPDPAVRLAIITDPFMPWTLDDLIAFAQDPDQTVRTAVTGLVVAAAV